MRFGVVIFFVIRRTSSSAPPPQLMVPRQRPTNLSRASTSHLDPSQGRLHRQFPSWQVPPFWQVTFLQGSFLQLCSVRAPKSAIVNPTIRSVFIPLQRYNFFCKQHAIEEDARLQTSFCSFRVSGVCGGQDPHSEAQQEVPPLPRHYLSTCSLPGLSSKCFPLCFCRAKCRSFSGRARRRAERRTMRRI